jgi:probable HAF family extracellular repeat protein
LVEIPRLSAAGSVAATGVNSRGVVVGTYETICTPDCGGGSRAWMYQEGSGSLVELTFAPSEWGASASGISDSGIIAGEEISLQYGLLAGYWTVTGGAVVLTGPSAGNDWAVAANDSGTLVGDYGASGAPGSLALMWSPPGYAETVLPGLECDYCPRLQIGVNGINDAGAAVGHSLYSVSNSNGGSSELLAVEWQSGTVTSLGSLNDSGTSDAYGISSSGDIVGASRISSSAGASTHAFLYHKGVMMDLGTLAGDVNSSAVAINDSGQIVGSSDDGNTSPASPLLGSVTLKNAAGVSSNGWIIVNGSDSRDTGQNAGTTRAFLLIPGK